MFSQWGQSNKTRTNVTRMLMKKTQLSPKAMVRIIMNMVDWLSGDVNIMVTNQNYIVSWPLLDVRTLQASWSTSRLADNSKSFSAAETSTSGKLTNSQPSKAVNLQSTSEAVVQEERWWKRLDQGVDGGEEGWQAGHQQACQNPGFFWEFLGQPFLF